MRALVLGGTGHIGAHVVRALAREGHAVRVLCRDRRRLSVLEGVPVDVADGSTDDADQLCRALDGCDWLFHVAGYYPSFTAEVAPAVASGIADVRRVLWAAQRVGVRRIVFTSSSSTIRRVPERRGAWCGDLGRFHSSVSSQEGFHVKPQPGRLAAETDWESEPLDHYRPLYPTVKIAMEQEALRAAREGLPVVVVNPALCLGEYDAKPFSGRMITIVAHGLPMGMYVEHRLNAVYTGDVGIGHVRAAERGRVGERYLLAGRNLRFSELVAVIARETEARPPRWRVPYAVVAGVAQASGWWWRVRGGRGEPWLLARAVEQVREGQFLDGARAARELGMPQTPVEEAVRRAVAWFRQQRML